MRSISYHLTIPTLAAGLFCLGVATPAAAALDSRPDLNAKNPALVVATATPAMASQDTGSQALAPARDHGELHASEVRKHIPVFIGVSGTGMW